MAIKINFKPIAIIIALVFSLICFFVVTFSILWSANKGFELSDETYYLFFSWNFNSQTYVVTNFGLLNHFFCFQNPSLLNLRLAKFFYQSFAVIIFTLSLFKFIKGQGYTTTKLQKIFFLLIALMTSYVNYDYLPMTLSYNTWSLIIMLLCFSVILAEYSYKSITASLITSILFGFLCFAFFLTKFPNAVIAVFIYFLFNILSVKHNLLYKIVGIAVGALIGYFVFINNFQDLKNICSNYYVTLFEVKHVKAASYFTQINDFFIFCCQKRYILLELIVLLFAVIIKTNIKSNKNILSYFLMALNYAFAIYFFRGNSGELYNDFMVACIIIINSFLFLYLFYRTENFEFPKMNFALIIFFLILAPFLLMLGTDNLFYYTTSQTMVFAIIGLVICLIYYYQFETLFLALQSVFICVFISSVLYQGQLKTPYRQTDLLEKRYPINFTEPLDGIYESYERFIDYCTLNALIQRFNTLKKPVFTFFTECGLRYVADCKVFPEAPISDATHAIWYNNYILERSKCDDNFDILVIPSKVQHSDEFKKMFLKCGIAFNKNYKLIYVYEFLSTKESVYLYKKVI